MPMAFMDEQDDEQGVDQRRHRRGPRDRFWAPALRLLKPEGLLHVAICDLDVPPACILPDYLLGRCIGVGLIKHLNPATAADRLGCHDAERTMWCRMHPGDAVGDARLLGPAIDIEYEPTIAAFEHRRRRRKTSTPHRRPVLADFFRSARKGVESSGWQQSAREAAVLRQVAQHALTTQALSAMT